MTLCVRHANITSADKETPILTCTSILNFRTVELVVVLQYDNINIAETGLAEIHGVKSLEILRRALSTVNSFNNCFL
jgi:hypothetical protein